MPPAGLKTKPPQKARAELNSADIAGEEIEYMMGLCHYGSILVACSLKGLCAVFLGDHPSRLLKELRRQFPKADLVGGDDEFEKLLVKVITFVEAPDKKLKIPLDIRGTAFQQRVWDALIKIPYGKTSNYKEVAMRIGAPKAIRAVAQACAANKLAVVIPCHRVLRLDGDLSGYQWGIKIKRQLLDREQN